MKKPNILKKNIYIDTAMRINIYLYTHTYICKCVLTAGDNGCVCG